jgi:hypothetical protein
MNLLEPKEPSRGETDKHPAPAAYTPPSIEKLQKIARVTGDPKVTGLAP